MNMDWTGLEWTEMDGQTDGWMGMGEWVDSWKDEWMDEWMCERTNEWMGF